MCNGKPQESLRNINSTNIRNDPECLKRKHRKFQYTLMGITCISVRPKKPTVSKELVSTEQLSNPMKFFNKLETTNTHF